jgi:pSer/pThr/pTyr-binding forkhead associated (FHA) protein
MIAQLIPLEGGNPISINKDLTLVGRNRDLCDLYINRNSISKLHCIIVKTDGLLFIRDLGSTNGTKVNGQRILRGALLPGDQLAFANIKFRVHLGPGEPEPEQGGATEVLTFPSEPLQEPPAEEFVPEDGSDSDVRLLEDD